MGIKDIANKLGVSTATVSRALNDRPGVSQELRDKILALANEEGYVPNLYGRGLATSNSQTIGFVVNRSTDTFWEDPFYPLIMAGAEDYLSKNGFHILVNTINDHTTQLDQLAVIKNDGFVDGLILAGPFIPASLITRLAVSRFPFVLVDNCLTQKAVNCVLSDDERGAYEATSHLIWHGHRRIAFLSGPTEWASNRERMRGYRRAMEEIGIEPLILCGKETTLKSGAELMEQALNKWSNLTAISAANDSMAIGAVREANKMGRKVPSDLAVIGFDDISLASVNQPRLSTMRIFKQRIGYIAAECLVANINDPNLPPTKTLVSTELVVRESCGCQVE